MNVRKAALEDALPLSSMCMDVQQLHVDHHPEFFKALKSVDFAEAFFREMLEKETAFIYIAEDDGDALGYVFCNLVDKPENPFTFARYYLMIEQISVRPNVQRQGVGKALMHQVGTTARELGVSRVHLGTWDFNTDAHGFFEKIGYRQRHLQYWKILE